VTSSVDRVRAALLAAGHPDTIASFPEGTKTVVDAAAAIGCSVAQIAKSIVLRSGQQPILVIASGVNRISFAKIKTALDRPVERADPVWVREITGFAVGGVAPIGHLLPPSVLIDEDLLVLDPVWAAAGSPSHTFQTNTQHLIQITGGTLADVREA
jgi:prolyl-tRNA editing enzyme YbaK/EbsC (Cys-tRNA(Pro) deacylase)